MIKYWKIHQWNQWRIFYLSINQYIDYSIPSSLSNRGYYTGTFPQSDIQIRYRYLRPVFIVSYILLFILSVLCFHFLFFFFLFVPFLLFLPVCITNLLYFFILPIFSNYQNLFYRINYIILLPVYTLVHTLIVKIFFEIVDFCFWIEYHY